MKRPGTLRAGLAVGLFVGLAGCASPCERVSVYARRLEPACTSCMSSNCSAEQQVLAGRTLACAGEFARAATCGSDCNCVYGALITATCREALDGVNGCMASRCEASCR